jgi:hypothetical protein
MDKGLTESNKVMAEVHAECIYVITEKEIQSLQILIQSTI